MSERIPTAGEELANCLSHGVGLLASLVALPLLALNAWWRQDAWQLVGATVFGVTLVLLYAASTGYHLLRPGSRAKQRFRLFDHAAIYLLIAGTYTPFTLGVLRGPWGWSLLAAVWTLALAGIALKIRVGFRYEWLSTAVYLVMGWLVLVALRPLVAQIGFAGFGWLLAGGLSYSVGVVFFAAKRLRFAHCYWHGFVLLGSACHLVAVVLYAGGTRGA